MSEREPGHPHAGRADFVAGRADFVAGRTSYLVGTTPPAALELGWTDVVDILRERYGSAVDVALSPSATDPEAAPNELPDEIRSPRATDGDPSWLRTSNMAGVNVRTVGDYAGVIKYALTLPRHTDSVHLLPIWEPGAVGSLYGMASWNLNPAFRSPELAAHGPHLDTAARQLRAVSNLLHVMGKTVGMDVIPHTDRFSEQALANPRLFEWMQIDDGAIVDWTDAVIAAAEDEIRAWYVANGAADVDGNAPAEAVAPDELFAVDETMRLAALFGRPDDADGRLARRISLLHHVKRARFEPVPATMGVPFRGIRIDDDPARAVVDDAGLTWPDFVIRDPQLMSRVFGPLARYRLYELDRPGSWDLDFARPCREAWDYVTRHYAAAQRIGAFDFMRGDMAHVQMRPDGVPAAIDDHYDILGAVKSKIAVDHPWFGYFAESFLPARDVFQYGEELDHLEASQADTTLGDLQSYPLGIPEFLQRFRRYLDDHATRRCAPSFTVITADKDDPRFDEFYRSGLELRLFTALFLTDMPSYASLGFELRDVRWEPAENERYTKLFVFHEAGESNVYPSKARFGDTYIWGSNTELFERVDALRRFAEPVLDRYAGARVRWLVPPDATGLRGTAVWMPDTDDADVVFVANFDTELATGSFGIQGLEPSSALEPIYSTTRPPGHRLPAVAHNGVFHLVPDVGPGEGRVYRITDG